MSYKNNLRKLGISCKALAIFKKSTKYYYFLSSEEDPSISFFMFRKLKYY